MNSVLVVFDSVRKDRMGCCRPAADSDFKLEGARR